MLSHQIIDWHAQLPSFKAPLLKACDQFYLRLLLLPAGHWGCPKVSKVFQIGRRILVNLGHPTPVHVIRRLCPRRGLGLWLGRGSWAFNSQPLKLPPPPNLSASLTPSFPIKRKSRKLNPKLPPPPSPQSHACTKPTVYKSWIRFWGGKAKKARGGEEAQDAWDLSQVLFGQILYSIARSLLHCTHYSICLSSPASKQILAKLGNSGIPPYLGIWRIFGVLPRKYGARTVQQMQRPLLSLGGSARAPFIACHAGPPTETEIIIHLFSLFAQITSKLGTYDRKLGEWCL